MGLLAERLAEVRNDPDWLNDDDELWDGRRTPAGVRVNDKAAFSLSAWWRCVDLLSSSVSMSPKDVILKVGGSSFPEYATPDWLSQPTTDPDLTIDDHFNQVALAVLIAGSSFTHAYPYTWDPRVLTVLNPLRVEVRPGPLYDIKDESGHVIRTLGPMEIIHIPWIRPPGSLRGLNPVSTLSREIGAAIASEEFASRFFGQGAALSFGVEVPYPYDEQKQEQLRDSLKKRYVGLSNSHAIGVLWDGAKFVNGLQPTPEQAQMIETQQFAIENTCRPFGVPPVLAGVNTPGASSYASADVAINTAYQRHAVLPLASRIEGHYRRLLSVPAGVKDPSARMQFKFNLDWIARANLLERYQAHAEGVRGGFLTPNEARKKEDYGPQDGGDQLYMQSQMLPITQLPVTNSGPSAPARSTEAL